MSEGAAAEAELVNEWKLLDWIEIIEGSENAVLASSRKSSAKSMVNESVLAWRPLTDFEDYPIFQIKKRRTNTDI